MKADPFDYSGGGRISVSVASIVASPRVQRQVQAVRDLRRTMDADTGADHRAALEYAELCNANQYYLTEGVQILATSYIELRKLAKAVLKIADRNTDVFNALRAAIGDDHG